MKKMFCVIFVILLASCGQFLNEKNENSEKIFQNQENNMKIDEKNFENIFEKNQEKAENFYKNIFPHQNPDFNFSLQEVNIPDIFVLPHHGITTYAMDNFYKKISKYHKKYDRIVVVSPDHFGKLNALVESLPQNINTITFQNYSVSAKNLFGYLPLHSRIFRQNGMTFEHGIGEHIIRISKFLPNIPVTPVIIRRDSVWKNFNQKLIKDLIELSKNEKILYIFSVDFSHHVREDIAVFHDIKAVSALNIWTEKDFDNLEVDCRNCLFVAKMLANHFWKNFFEAYLRTSVDTISWGFSHIDNTSHIFGGFSEKENTLFSKKYILVLLGDDLQKDELRSEFFQLRDFSLSPRKFYHHIATSFDEVFVISWKNFKNFSSFFPYSVQIVENEKREFFYENIRFQKNEKNIIISAFWQEKNFSLSDAMLVCEIENDAFECFSLAYKSMRKS